MVHGKIARHDEIICLEEWKQILASKHYLERIPDRVVISPFTNQAINADGDGRAYYIVNGKRVGAIVLEEGALLTDSVPIAICNEIAHQLDARVTEENRS